MKEYPSWGWYIPLVMYAVGFQFMPDGAMWRQFVAGVIFMVAGHVSAYFAFAEKRKKIVQDLADAKDELRSIRDRQMRDAVYGTRPGMGRGA